MATPFPKPEPAQWTALATQALKDRPIESLIHLDADGLVVRPLYGAATGGEALMLRRAREAQGRDWDLRVQVEGDDADEVNGAILAALTGGAASVIVSGAVLGDSAPLARALDGVAMELAAVGLDAGLDGPQAADALAVAAKGAPRARLMFHMDPISSFARDGTAPRPIAAHLTLAANTAARHAEAYPLAGLFLASGRVVHEAGGSIVQELAFAAACAVALIRAGVEAGLSVERAVGGTTLGVALDADYFDGMAKVRALRLMGRTIAGAFGTEMEMPIEARSSRRMLGRRDPWPNLLRLTAAGFAGAVGGADAVVLDAFTQGQGRPDAFAARQARNTQLVLMEEAHLGRVDDPASGSWFLDHRTREIAEAAWAEFQWIESEGGLVEVLKAGLIQSRVARVRDDLIRQVAEEVRPMVGVTKFVDPDPRPTRVLAPIETPVRAGGDRCAPLSPLSLTQPHEPEIGA